VRLPGSFLNQARYRRTMAKASHKLAHKHALCLRAALDFSPALCSAGAPRARGRAYAPGPRCGSVVGGLWAAKSLIFLKCGRVCRLSGACP
jgi:hypothetical protein